MAHSYGLIEKVPPSCSYIPEFVTKDEEAYLLKRIAESPIPKWTQLSNRRLQNYGGLPHAKGMFPEPIPQWLDVYCKKISALGVFGDHSANHVLVNEYVSGQGIMPHVDGDLYYPTISTISLGSHTTINFYRPLEADIDTNASNQNESWSSRRVASILLEPRSLFLVSQDMYTSYLHGIDSTTSDHITLMTLTHESWSSRRVASILLEPRSLFLVSQDMYTSYLHGIDSTTSDHITDDIANIDCCTSAKVGDVLLRSTRVSLTIRYVPKVLQTKLFNNFWKR